MLEWLRVKNYALIDEMEIEFGKGFNVITGETGAGKSVIMGSINLLLGERGGKNVIRTGARGCEISARLSLHGELLSKMNRILDESGIEPCVGGSVLLRRVITSSSGRNFINDCPVTLRTLKKTGDLIIDVHGANEHQSLLKNSVQLYLVDRFAKTSKELEVCAGLFVQINTVKEKKNKVESGIPTEVEAEYLRMTVSEIQKTAPQPGEDEELSAKHALAANSKQIMEITSKASAIIDGTEESINSHFSDVYRELLELERVNPGNAKELAGRCAGIMEESAELAIDIQDYAAGIELDERDFYELEERISAIEKLKRRYGPSLENVFETLDASIERLNIYDNAGEIKEKLKQREMELENALSDACEKLSAKRRKAAARLAEDVRKELTKLGFLKSGFEIEFSKSSPGPSGYDKLEFMFNANPGEKLQPLKNIASSGEMSRIMLALKRVLAEHDSVPVLIFDEIDVNIGGPTAAVVGRELAALGKKHQVLCISHLAQVAAEAGQHYNVSKETGKDGRTSAYISRLSGARRKKELARMLGGTKGAEHHAEELLNSNNI